MIIKSDINKFKNGTEAINAAMKAIDQELPKELLKIEVDFVTQIMHRVKHSGVSANGVVLRTKSNNPIGAYGQWHGKARKKKGLRVDQVNLSFTGRMQLDFNITEHQDLHIGIGFLAAESALKAEDNEEYYGDEIFEPSNDEETDTMNDAEARLFALLMRVLD